MFYGQTRIVYYAIIVPVRIILRKYYFVHTYFTNDNFSIEKKK